MSVEEPAVRSDLDALLRSRLGHVLHPWPARVLRVLDELASRHNKSAAELLREVRSRPAAFASIVDTLVSAATISHTAFFRHPEQLEYLRDTALKRRHAEVNRTLRIWSAACSTGEEAWSIAMCARDAGVPAEVLATDVDPDSIAFAERGVYRPDRARGVPRSYRLVPTGPWEVPDRLRTLVRFQVRSLIDGSPMARGFDFVFCRNVLIYFSFEDGARVVDTLRASVARGGSLILSPVEVLLRAPGARLVGAPLGWLPDRELRRSITLMPPPATRPTPAHAPKPAAPKMAPPAQPLEPADDDNGAPNPVVEAARLLGDNKPDEAEAALREHLDQDPKDAEAWFLLGEALLARGERVQARIAFEQAKRSATSGGRTGMMDQGTLIAAAERRASQLR